MTTQSSEPGGTDGSIPDGAPATGRAEPAAVAALISDGLSNIEYVRDVALAQILRFAGWILEAKRLSDQTIADASAIATMAKASTRRLDAAQSRLEAARARLQQSSAPEETRTGR